MEDKTLYQCAVCELHYSDEEDAKKCFVFCSQHNACNVELTKHSVEYRELKEQAQERDDSKL